MLGLLVAARQRTEEVPKHVAINTKTETFNFNLQLGSSVDYLPAGWIARGPP